MYTNVKDFYETPGWLIDKMLDCIKKDRIYFPALSFLEPSAGRGAIAERIIAEIKGSRADDKKYVDLIEIEPELQHVLKGKELKLVHDDFMTFNTFKPYDVIIANFPFSVGDKHLMKAIQMQERHGGQIVCLVNAETLRNPFTNLRKELRQKLDRYEAEIEYLSDAFEEGERPSDVEVALINVTMPSIISIDESLILEQMEMAKEYEEMDDSSNAVASSEEIKRICETFRYMAESGVRFIEEYYRLNAAVFSADIKDSRYEPPLISLMINGQSTKGYDKNKTKAEAVNEFLEATRLKYWNLIFNSSSIRSLTTEQVYDSLQAMLDDMRQYDVTPFNAYQIQRSLIETLSENIEDAIEKMFDNLTKYADDGKNILYYNGWKTNKGWKLGKKAIIPLNAFNTFSKRMDIDYKIKPRIVELQKVLNYLCTGKQKIDVDELHKKLEEYNQQGQMKNLEFDYFKLTFYKRGTCHIEFKDERLIERFNIFVGKKRSWLPPTYGKKEYYNMTPEEKDVIDGFQDQFSYERCRRDDDVQRVIRDNRFLLEMEA